MNNNRILILGGTGVLGKALLDTCNQNQEIFITYQKELPEKLQRLSTRQVDIRSKEQIKNAFDWADPGIVIHLAGIANVDLAETDYSLAYEVNVEGTVNVINACKRHRSKLIFLSSNAVYNGDHPPYDEEAPRSSVNSYGNMKIQCEDLISNCGLNFSIIRAILMYGWHYPSARANPVTNWIANLKNDKPIKVVDDRFSQPLFAQDCANTVWSIINQQADGIYNVAGPDRLSLFDFAIKVADVFNFNKDLITPVPSNYFPNIAPRPVDTSFIIDKIRNQLLIQPRGIDEGLKLMKLTQEV